MLDEIYAYIEQKYRWNKGDLHIGVYPSLFSLTKQLCEGPHKIATISCFGKKTSQSLQKICTSRPGSELAGPHEIVMSVHFIFCSKALRMTKLK